MQKEIMKTARMNRRSGRPAGGGPDCRCGCDMEANLILTDQSRIINVGWHDIMKEHGMPCPYHPITMISVGPAELSAPRGVRRQLLFFHRGLDPLQIPVQKFLEDFLADRFLGDLGGRRGLTGIFNHADQFGPGRLR